MHFNSFICIYSYDILKDLPNQFHVLFNIHILVPAFIIFIVIKDRRL